MPAIDIVARYLDAVEREEWGEVSQYLDEGVCFRSPHKDVNGKDQYLDLIKAKHEEWKKSGPKWDDVIPGEQENQAFNKGTVKLLMIKVSIKRTFELTSDGKICSIVIKKM
eukprot:GFYU01005361.1.p2 GENE.GFYU01005361.1~~GFYU01005361.1.p2  ORF type:complete len:111 (-),score=39.58 GFYU01005361.1:163-495(-)